MPRRRRHRQPQPGSPAPPQPRPQQMPPSPPQPRPQQMPPAPLPGGDEDGDDFRAQLKKRWPAVVMSVVIQVVIFFLVIPGLGLRPIFPAPWERLLRFFVLVSLSGALYLFIPFAFAFAGHFPDTPLRLLVANHFLMAITAIQRPWRSNELTWDVLFSSLVFMFYILLVQGTAPMIRYLVQLFRH